LNEPAFKLQQLPASQEVLWVFEEKASGNTKRPAAVEEPSSTGFPDARTYVLRSEESVLLFNVKWDRNGRQAPGHNDALSIEVSGCGQPFLVDPGLSFIQPTCTNVIYSDRPHTFNHSGGCFRAKQH